MAYEDITLTIEGGLATVTLNRPDALNAISLQMLADLDAALDEITAPDSGVRCLLMTGAGRGFCAGADLAGGGGLQGQGPIDLGHVLERHYNPLIQRLGGLSMPFVTAVNGPAAGAGMSFALAVFFGRVPSERELSIGREVAKVRLLGARSMVLGLGV